MKPLDQARNVLAFLEDETHGHAFDKSVRGMPLLDGPRPDRAWAVAAFLLGAIACDTLGDPRAAERALQHALDLAGPDQVPPRHLQVLTHGETRVLSYLPTNLSAREIADELYLSVNTVKTHQRHLYQKLGARSRTQAVDQARALGLLASSSRKAQLQT
jgi:LuxR family transcriptional regulator, maltose regulon positive regulatory protein